MKKCIMLLTLSICMISNMVIAMADHTKSGSVAILRYHNSGHPVIAARGHIMFTMDETYDSWPNSPCVWIWIPPEDQIGINSIMMAKRDNLYISIHYTQEASPWGDQNVCRAIAIDWFYPMSEQ